MALTGESNLQIESLPEQARSFIAGLEKENRLLRETIRLLRLAKYGPKSEKLSGDQLSLLELEPGVAAPEVDGEANLRPGRKKITERKHAGRNPLPAHLPRREEIIRIEGEERLCECCGEPRCLIGYGETTKPSSSNTVDPEAPSSSTSA